MVGSTPCGVRSRRRTPNACSRSLMASDTAGWEMPRWAAALAMLPDCTVVNRMKISRSLRRRPMRLSQFTRVRFIGKHLGDAAGLTKFDLYCFILAAIANCIGASAATRQGHGQNVLSPMRCLVTRRAEQFRLDAGAGRHFSGKAG